MRDVGELVGHDRFELRLGRIVDQGVVEDYPLGRANSRYVGVERRAAAAGVDPEDLAHVHPGPLAQSDHARAEVAVLRQRIEVVEAWRDQDRREQAHHGPVADHDDRAWNPPIPRIAPDQARQRRGARPRDDRADHKALGLVSKPRSKRLGRQADVDGALVSRESHRKGRRIGDDDHQDASRGGTQARAAS